MLARAASFALLASLCMGVSCSIGVPGDDDDDTTPGYVQLDRATAELKITAAVGDSNADVTASIRRSLAAVELKNGQEVAVNGTPLQGPGSGGLYSRSIPRATAYTVKVTEPTLGTNDTPLATPADFSITSPATGASVSLANGFTLNWSQPDASVTYTVTLSQTLGDAEVQVLGPFADDSGSLAVTAADLMKFRQGADVAIKLTKTAQTSEIGGFSVGTARVELSRSLSVVPAP